MRWEDERYVRLFTRDTPEWVALSWQARALFGELLRKVDRAGLLPIGRSGVKGLAGLVRMPTEVVEPALDELIADGCVERTDDGIVLPNFIAAQEANQSDRARKAASRERAAAVARNVTNRDDESQDVTSGHESGQNVTRGHTESRAVTNGHSVPGRAVPGRTDPPVVPHGTQPSLEDLLGPAAPKPGPVDVVWSAYVEAHASHTGKRAALALNDARRGLIRRRLKDHSAEQLVAAARGVFRDTWCVERSKWEPEWVWQNAGNVERFAALGGPGGGLRPSATEDPDESERRRLGPAPKAPPVERQLPKPWDELDAVGQRLWGTREAYEAKCMPRAS